MHQIGGLCKKPQNVVDLSRTLQTLKEEGHPVSREDMAVLSPYLTRHIKRFGDYVLDLSKEPDPLGIDLDIPEEVVANAPVPP